MRALSDRPFPTQPVGQEPVGQERVDEFELSVAVGPVCLGEQPVAGMLGTTGRQAQLISFHPEQGSRG